MLCVLVAIYGGFAEVLSYCLGGIAIDSILLTPSSYPPLFTQQRNIPDWLETLQMEEYTEVFRRAGYSKEEDVENLKELNRRELNRIGVVKMGKLHCYHDCHILI